MRSHARAWWREASLRRLAVSCPNKVHSRRGVEDGVLGPRRAFYFISYYAYGVNEVVKPQRIHLVRVWWGSGGSVWRSSSSSGWGGVGKLCGVVFQVSFSSSFLTGFVMVGVRTSAIDALGSRQKTDTFVIFVNNAASSCLQALPLYISFINIYIISL